MPFRPDPKLEQYKPITPVPEAPTPEPKRISFFEKAGKFLGIEPLGRGLGLAAARIPGIRRIAAPEIADIEAKMKRGEELTPGEAAQYGEFFKEAPTTKEVLGAAGVTAATMGFFAGPKLAAGAFRMARGLKPAMPSLKAEMMKFGGLSAFLGASEAVEKGENIEGVIRQAGVGAAVGIAAPPAIRGIGKVITKTIKGLPSIFSITTAGQKKAFEFQLKNPRLAKTAVKMGKSPDEIAQGMSKALEKYYDDIAKEYTKNASIIAKKYPKKTFFKERYWFLPEQIDRIFNKVGSRFDIQITKSGLQFARGGRISPIAKGAEQNRIKEIYSALKNWEDFSAEGSTKLLNYLNKVRKFETTIGTRESVFVSGVMREIKRPIYQRYPEIEGLFNNYARKIQFADEVDTFLKGVHNADAQAQVGAARNIMKIFDEDKEPLYRMAEKFERETGLSILAELAAAELSSSFPPIIRSVLGVGALTQIFNPTLVLALPLFIQRVAATITRQAGKFIQAVPGVGRAVTPPTVYGSRRLFRSQ